MKVIDLNADIGEADNPEWERAELGILNYVSSVNIACGGHAGDEASMRKTIKAAKAKGVVIGAHPAYPDRGNFGRRSLKLGEDIDAEVLRGALKDQIAKLMEIAADENVVVAYVKPHGALYNDAVKNRELADLISDVVADFGEEVMYLGGPNSCMEASAKARGLTFVREGFIDRRYTDDGHLQSRTIEGAVIKDQETRMAQARSLVMSGSVETASGNGLKINARSLCLHGDSDAAVETARLARREIEACGVTIRAFADV